MCISNCGVNLWNGLEEELKESRGINQFKKRYKKVFFERYRDVDVGVASLMTVTHVVDAVIVVFVVVGHQMYSDV